jgi:hypothetical protein
MVPRRFQKIAAHADGGRAAGCVDIIGPDPEFLRPNGRFVGSRFHGWNFATALARVEAGDMTLADRI